MDGYFYGWYLKCQSKENTLALIPAVHDNGVSRTSSLQIITDDGAWVIDAKGKDFKKTKSNIFIAKNRFGVNGIRVNMENADVKIKGKIDFGPLHPIKYDIMGPFSLIPFMECRHAVYSMRHTVNGSLLINGKKYNFENALGYWEGDSGRSFPSKYAWTQTLFNGGSLMLSVADIPFMGFHFTGIIGIVNWHNKEYRFATYLGAHPLQISDKTVRVAQCGMELEARLIETKAHDLAAPVGGSMIRTIRESASCKAYYRFRIEGKTVFAFKTEKASFEYEYNK